MTLSRADSLRRPRPALPADPGRLRRAPQRGRRVEEELRAGPQDGGALRPDGALRPGEGRQSRRGREEGILGVARAEALREAGAAHVLDRVLGEAALRSCDSPLKIIFFGKKLHTKIIFICFYEKMILFFFFYYKWPLTHILGFSCNYL